MNDNLASEQIGFTLSPSAQEHLSKVLPYWTKQASEQDFVPILSFAGGGRTEKDGKVTWKYNGALFLLGGQRREKLKNGKFFDLLGFPVWIGEMDQLLLQGRVLTFMAVGGPEPEEHLVIENAPEDFLGTALKENASCGSCRNPNDGV